MRQGTIKQANEHNYVTMDYLVTKIIVNTFKYTQYVLLHSLDVPHLLRAVMYMILIVHISKIGQLYLTIYIHS